MSKKVLWRILLVFTAVFWFCIVVDVAYWFFS